MILKITLNYVYSSVKLVYFQTQYCCKHLIVIFQLTLCTTSLSDAAGNEYDLSDLSKEGEPWVAIDTSKEAKKQTFFLNVCKPLPYVPGCPGKPSGKHFLTRGF